MNIETTPQASNYFINTWIGILSIAKFTIKGQFKWVGNYERALTRIMKNDHSITYTK